MLTSQTGNDLPEYVISDLLSYNVFHTSKSIAKIAKFVLLILYNLLPIACDFCHRFDLRAGRIQTPLDYGNIDQLSKHSTVVSDTIILY